MVRLKENVQWINDISFKKYTEKIVLLQLNDLIHVIVFRAEKIFVHVSIIHQTFCFWGALNIVHENNCATILLIVE